jgi:hypothetical protein
LGATPLEWQDGLQQIQAEAQFVKHSAWVVASSRSESLVLQIAAEKSIVTTNTFQVEATGLTPVPVPILALPESGTLILLGIGLAGIASLIRRKKDSS